MTRETKNSIRAFIPYLAFLPTFYVVYAFGRFTENAEGRMFKDPAQKEDVIHHVMDNEVHMPYSEKVKVFVPRTEIEALLQDIPEIKSDIKELLKSKKN